MKTRKIINKVHMEALQGEGKCATANTQSKQKKLKSLQPHPALNKTSICFGGAESGISLRVLGNHHVPPYKARKDIHLLSTKSLVGL